MNATEDGVPLGEAPEVVLPSDALSNLRFAAIAVAEIRELHRSRNTIPHPVCNWCACSYPCPTVQVLDKWGV